MNFSYLKTRQKGLQSNSGPNVDIALAIVYCFSLRTTKAVATTTSRRNELHR